MEWVKEALGWLIGLIVAAILGTTFVVLITTMNKKVVRDKKGNIDFRKSDNYFYWKRWDYTILIVAVYTFFANWIYSPAVNPLDVFSIKGNPISRIVLYPFLFVPFFLI